MVFEFEWSFIVPESGLGRMGWNDDNLFMVAYWFPKMAVLDDVVGWHVDPGGAACPPGRRDLHAGLPEVPGGIIGGIKCRQFFKVVSILAGISL